MAQLQDREAVMPKFWIFVKNDDRIFETTEDHPNYSAALASGQKEIKPHTCPVDKDNKKIEHHCPIRVVSIYEMGVVLTTGEEPKPKKGKK